jgi:DNA polymerase III delta subunit
MKPAYLFHGTDDAKIDKARSRLRTRAESEGGTASLEVFDLVENRGSPDADALVAAIFSMSLIPGRRYLLSDHIEKWGKKQAERVSEAVAGAPPDVTVVLIARGKVPSGIAETITRAGGEVRSFEAPEGRALVNHLVKGAGDRGFQITPEAAGMLISHLGDGLTRLANEMDRLALWAGPGGTVEIEDLEGMITDSSGLNKNALGQALAKQDRILALRLAGRLIARGGTVPSSVYFAADSVRRIHKAALLLESGVPPNRVVGQLRGRPSDMRQAVELARSTSHDAMRDAAIALADLEIWTRGGTEYPDELALDLALIAATDDAG